MYSTEPTLRARQLTLSPGKSTDYFQSRSSSYFLSWGHITSMLWKNSSCFQHSEMLRIDQVARAQLHSELLVMKNYTQMLPRKVPENKQCIPQMRKIISNVWCQRGLVVSIPLTALHPEQFEQQAIGIQLVHLLYRMSCSLLHGREMKLASRADSLSFCGQFPGCVVWRNMCRMKPLSQLATTILCIQHVSLACTLSSLFISADTVSSIADDF